MNRIQRVAFLLAAMLCAGFSSAAAQSGPGHDACADAGAAPIVRYTLRSGELRRNSDWLSISVYANRCVRVHRPTFYTTPGDHGARLSAPEFDALIRELDLGGVFEFDADSTARAAAELERGRLAESERSKQPLLLVEAEGAPVAQFEIDLTTEFRSAHALRASAARRSYSWRALSLSVQRYPEIEALAALERAQARLLALGKAVTKASAESQP